MRWVWKTFVKLTQKGRECSQKNVAASSNSEGDLGIQSIENGELNNGNGHGHGADWSNRWSTHSDGEYTKVNDGIDAASTCKFDYNAFFKNHTNSNGSTSTSAKTGLLSYAQENSICSTSTAASASASSTVSESARNPKSAAAPSLTAKQPKIFETHVAKSNDKIQSIPECPRTSRQELEFSPKHQHQLSQLSTFDENLVKWKQLFNKFDREGFGEIPWMPDFRNALRSPEFASVLNPGKILLLEDMVLCAINAPPAVASTAITFQHFVNVMSGKRSRSYKCAVHQRDREVFSESDFHVYPQDFQPIHGVKRFARMIADEFLPEKRDRKYYSENYTCLPPPLFFITLTLIQFGFFTYYSTTWQDQISLSGPIPADSSFIYRPDNKMEVWRFLFYVVLHAGWAHLLFNFLVQVLVGFPLEMTHGSLRIGFLYMAGILAGSLCTSVLDPEVYLVGASGGVYALLAAHLANVLLNYNAMDFGIFRLLGVFVAASVDVGFAIYTRYSTQVQFVSFADEATMTDRFETSTTMLPLLRVAFIPHLSGVAVGLTVGLQILKNYEQKLREQLSWWITISLYGAFVFTAILLNVFRRPQSSGSSVTSFS